MKRVFIISAFFILTAFGINELPQIRGKSFYGSDYVGSSPRPVYADADGNLRTMYADTTAIGGGGGGGGGEDLSATLAIGNASTTPLYITGHSTTDMKGSFGGIEFLSYSTNLNFISSNLYFNGTDHKYRETGYGGYLYFNSGKWIFSTAPSGTAGATATHTNRMEVTEDGVFIADGGGPPTPTGGAYIYAASGEMGVKDASGNSTNISPHNFSGIPEGKSEDMAWSFYSEKDGKYINVDMLKLARLLEKLTGEKLVYMGDTDKKPQK